MTKNYWILEGVVPAGSLGNPNDYDFFDARNDLSLYDVLDDIRGDDVCITVERLAKTRRRVILRLAKRAIGYPVFHYAGKQAYEKWEADRLKAVQQFLVDDGWHDPDEYIVGFVTEKI